MTLILPLALFALESPLLCVFIIGVVLAGVWHFSAWVFKMQNTFVRQVTQPQSTRPRARSRTAGTAPRPDTNHPALLAQEPEFRNALPFAVFQAAENKQQADPSYVFSDAERVARGAEWLSTAFQWKGLEWTTLHFSTGEMLEMKAVAEMLGLHQVATLIDEAVQYYGDGPDDAFTELDYDHPDAVAYRAYFKNIENRFDALGGMAIVHQMADDYLDRHYPWAQ